MKNAWLQFNASVLLKITAAKVILTAKSEIDHPYHTKRMFFFRRHRAKASEIDPREALELNLGKNLLDDDEMLMFSAGGDVDESALPRSKH